MNSNVDDTITSALDACRNLISMRLCFMVDCRPYRNRITVAVSIHDSPGTTHELLLWEQPLYGGRVVSAASLKKMTTPYKENYGGGLMITTAKGHLRYEHGGGIEGFNTDMA